jgi:hypothetical protein
MLDNASIPGKFRHKSSEEEILNRGEFFRLFRNSPIPDEHFLNNLGLFLNRQSLSRILFMHEIYSKIINTHGVVMEFGVRWGQNLALFSAFRGMYEPYNYNRKIIGFDTFSGFPAVSDEDGCSELIRVGSCEVVEGYEEYLERILSCHEKFSPISHIKKFELIKGDAVETFERYLKNHPETIVALAYFDFVLYEPTKRCLELLTEHLTKGSVIAFDELNNEDCPGETIALREILGLDHYKIQRSSVTPGPSYFIIE